jgi:Skp family chaperone for outer membrane proteins
MRPLHTLLCLTATVALVAQPAQDPAPRIGMLAAERVIDRSVRAHKLFSELETLKKTLSDRIDAKRAEIQKLSSQLQSPSIGEAGKENIQKELRDKDFEGKKLQEDSQNEYQKTQQRVVAQFQQEISPIVEELAKEQKLQLVLTYNPGMVAYADQNWVLAFTDEVGRRYDAKCEPQPAAGAKPAAKPKSKP